jgi:hypothetical protein
MQNDRHTICYVDENPTSATDFAGEMQDYFNVVQIVVEDSESIDILIARIKAFDFQYLAVDYHLGQDINVEYDGDTVIQRYTEEFKDFPYMMISSDGKGAISHSEGVLASNVFDKDEIYDLDRRDYVVGRIVKSIDQYRDRLAIAEKRYKELLDKRDSSELSLKEETEATELNELIDNSLGASSPMLPIDVTNGERLMELITKTDELLEKIKNNDNI